MLEYYSSGPAAPLGESLDASLGSGSEGSAGGVDVRDELLNENILALSVFDLRIIVPAHGATVWKNVNGGRYLFGSNRLVDEGG